MNVHLLYPDRDLRLDEPTKDDAQALVQDLALEPLFRTMAQEDGLIGNVVRSVLLAHGTADLSVIRFRQEALSDCLAHGDIVLDLYQCAGEGLESVRQLGILGFYSRSPSSMLYSGLKVLGALVPTLKRLRMMAASAYPRFRSRAFRNLFETIESELDDVFFGEVESHRRELEFRDGVLMSAVLGAANKGTNYELKQSGVRHPTWAERLFRPTRDALSFSVAPRDEAGHRALEALRDRALHPVAHALLQSNDHMMAFLTALRTELAFYLGCTHLHSQLVDQGLTVCFPVALPPDRRTHACSGLFDLSLVLGGVDGRVCGNDLDIVDRWIILVTGANRGGKTTFLRALGQAQLMMQAGMFVPAASFTANVSDGIFTHFKRREDASMERGKLDEELQRLSAVVTRLRRNSLLIMNESFASTHEVEGSELALQILSALALLRVKVVFVTHLYTFARMWYEAGREDTWFLRAERLSDGTRTFRMITGEPFDTSFGEDVYRRVFSPPEGDDTRLDASALPCAVEEGRKAAEAREAREGREEQEGGDP